MAHENLQKLVSKNLNGLVDEVIETIDCLTLEVSAENLLEVCKILKEYEGFKFEMLIDLCGVDYSDYGYDEWSTEETTSGGFSRGVAKEDDRKVYWKKGRFATVYHLLSISLNQRIRLKVYAYEEPPVIPSVYEIYNSANWYEREAFDLFGIMYEGHPDLRRILTDYGFIGHPFRKDFPLIGTVEMRYDAAKGRVVYEPVSIESRTLVPKTIRDDCRYIDGKEKA